MSAGSHLPPSSSEAKKMPVHKEEWEERSRAVFSGGYQLNQNSFPAEPQPKTWKCQDGYLALTRLSVSSHPNSLEVLHALLQASCLQATAATGTAADLVCKESWLGEHSSFYLFFCMLTLHCKCCLCFSLAIINPKKVHWNHWALSES